MTLGKTLLCIFIGQVTELHVDMTVLCKKMVLKRAFIGDTGEESALHVYCLGLPGTKHFKLI